MLILYEYIFLVFINKIYKYMYYPPRLIVSWEKVSGLSGQAYFTRKGFRILSVYLSII